MKKIRARMIRAKGSCYNPTDLDGIDSKTSWTLLEWMNYKHYKNGTDDAIWVFSKMADSKTARKFAIWCSKRCKTEVPEIKNYIKVIEGHYLNGTHTHDEVIAAGCAAGKAADKAADKAAGKAADWAAYRAADWAAYRAAGVASGWEAYWVADKAAYRAKERKAQLNKIKRMLKVA